MTSNRMRCVTDCIFEILIIVKTFLNNLNGKSVDL